MGLMAVKADFPVFAHMQSDALAVMKCLRRGQRRGEKQAGIRTEMRPLDLLQQDPIFQLRLALKTYMQEIAAATLGKVRTGRRDPVR